MWILGAAAAGRNVSRVYVKGFWSVVVNFNPLVSPAASVDMNACTKVINMEQFDTLDL